MEHIATVTTTRVPDTRERKILRVHRVPLTRVLSTLIPKALKMRRALKAELTRIHRVLKEPQLTITATLATTRTMLSHLNAVQRKRRSTNHPSLLHLLDAAW